MIFEVSIGNLKHRVEVLKTSTGLALSVDGEAAAADVIPMGPDALSLLLGGKSFEVLRLQTSEGQAMVVNGRAFPVEVVDPRSYRARKRSGASDAGPRKITAPMPGKVVRILAAAGDPVEAGQPVIVIEAMKMQNELKSPKPGRVQKILVAEGTAVNAGDPLAIIE